MLIPWAERLARARREPLTAVYFGTPEFAVPALRRLHDDPRVTVQGVVSQPDRPFGRGRVLRPPPVAAVAVELGLPLAQPVKIADLQPWLAAFGPTDLFVVAAFGRILPDWLLLMPTIGPLNLHASLLPRHRGAAPIQAAILAGDAQTGVTLMGMEPALDAGPMLADKALPILDTDTAGDLFERLAEIAGDLLIESLDGLLTGTLQPTPQDDVAATYAGRIVTADAEISWAQPAAAVDRHVRAMAPQPGAWSMLGDLRVRILAGRQDPLPGRAIGAMAVVDDGLRVGCGVGSYVVTTLQVPGRPAVPAVDWLRGHTLRPDDAFSAGPRP
jgi:methionyl-tRNA formyltransferase